MRIVSRQEDEMRFLIGLAATLAACTSSAPRHYVLVHGAWSDQHAWDTVAAKLRAAGAKVDTIDLPGHGSDTTPIDQLSMAAYADRVGQAIDAAGGKVILVGHSMAGMVISQAAENRPSQIRSLVYVGAYVPQSGQSLFALATSDPGSHVGANLEQKGATIGIKTDAFPDLFCADCDATAKQALVASYHDEPAAPLQQPVTLTDNFARLPKTYIHTTNDQVVSPGFQHQMTQATPMTHERDIATSHMAMLAQPDELVGLLLEE